MTGLWDSPSVPDPAACPRGRGNPNADMSEPYYWRSIPAWAGEPRINPRLGRWRGVYPRVGGGTRIRRVFLSSGIGLSPRGRGNRGDLSLLHALFRSIPAWAGEPNACVTLPNNHTVYPRVGGGTDDVVGFLPVVGGLSPRGRGNHLLFPVLVTLHRSIPAWAGEPSTVVIRPASDGVYPRVGGGTGC